MALPVNLSQRELNKFVLDPDGKVAINTVLSSDVQLGSVEIKDGVADIRQSIASTASGNPGAVFLMDRDGHAADINASGQLLSTAVLTGNVTLNPSPNFIGLVTVANNVVLGAGANYVGLATVNLGQAIPAGDNNIGNVDIVSGTITSVTQLNGIAVANSATEGLQVNQRNNVWTPSDGTQNAQNTIRLNDSSSLFMPVYPHIFNGTTWDRPRTVGAANATTGVGLLGAGILGFDGTNYERIIVDTSGVLRANVSLSASANYIGLASVNIGGTLPAGTNYIGLATTVQANQPALVASSAYIGLASVNIGGTLPALVAGTAYIGLASVNIGGTLPVLSAGTNYIGLATVNIGTPASGAVGDSATAGPTTITVGTIPLLYNQSTVDRARAVTATMNFSSAAGIAASGLVGQLDDTSPTAITENQFGLARISAGRAVLTQGLPEAVSTYYPSSDVSAAYEASSVSKASAGAFFSMVGYNSRTSTQFIQIFNSATVPADGAAPVFTFAVPASSNFSLDIPKGHWFSTGISWSNSSTGATKTLGSADVFATVEYI